MEGRKRESSTQAKATEKVAKKMKNDLKIPKSPFNTYIILLIK